MDVENQGGEVLANAYEEVDFEPVLDSGSVDHIRAKADIPGYRVVESDLSAKKQSHIVGNGKPVATEGQAELNLQCGDANGKTNSLTSTFQVAAIVRPLMPVSRIRDTGMTVTFEAAKAEVTDGKNNVVCTVMRQGCFYVCPMRLRQPFHRQGE